MKTVKLPELDGKKYETMPPDNILEVVSTEGLSVGQHTFSLTVVDSAGNESQAAKVIISVLDATAPNARLTVLDENKVATQKIKWGSTFYLSAEGSSDTPSEDLGGKIASYIWTLESTV